MATSPYLAWHRNAPPDFSAGAVFHYASSLRLCQGAAGSSLLSLYSATNIPVVIWTTLINLQKIKANHGKPWGAKERVLV